MKKGIIRFGLATIGLALSIALVLACFTPPAAAQDKKAPPTGNIKGTVKDEQSKPLEGVIILIKPDGGGVEVQAKTGADGKYLQGGLAPGMYDVTFVVNGEIVYHGSTKVAAGAGHDQTVNISLDDPDVKAYRAKTKAYSEEMKKVNALKAHVDAGNAALAQAKDIRKQALHAPSDQKADLQAKVTPFATQAINELQQALTAVGENGDEDRRVIYGLLGDAYDTLGKYDDEAQALQKAAEISPPAAAYYNNLGNALAKGGKIEDARAAYQKSAELDPANSALAYRNFGAVLYNAGNLENPGIVDMLKKATDLDPKNAQGWFLYAAALAANMKTKQEGDKLTFILLPGTIEAYQKCIEIEPTGQLATLARQAVEGLNAMGLGVTTKVTTPKTKH